MTKLRSRLVCGLALPALFFGLFVTLHAQQKMDSVSKGQVKSMLNNVKNAIKKDYYDPTFHGIDLDAHFAAAEQKLKSAEYLGQAFGIIAQAVIDLNDSHTTFYPPARNSVTEYGWKMRMYGDSAFITAVKDGSDAQKKGLKPGDEVLKLNGFAPARTELWKMIYFYQILNPQTKLVLDIKRPSGEVAKLEVESKVTRLKNIVNFADSVDFNEMQREGAKLEEAEKHEFREVGGALIWKMPSFSFEPSRVGGYIGKAKGKQTLIFDLRGNPGGYVATLEKLAGYLLEKDTKIADMKGRKKFDPSMAKTQGNDVFTGKVIVLVDSASGSAAEILARLMQIEKRGIVLGDVSSGAVMMSRRVGFDAGNATMISYGMNLTRADVIMSDGKSLEHVGVQPDEVTIPTAKDIAERRDPVLSRALELAGVQMDPEAAGKLFPEPKFIDRKSNLAILLEF